VRATNRLCSSFRKTEMLHLTFVNKFLHRSGDVFDRDVQIDPMLIKQIDDIGLEPLERSLSSLLNVLRVTI
jgi:hypothetical protein